MIEDCKTISGTIESIKKSKDGDDHIQIKLDPQFASLINSVNISKQNGYLVVEVICKNIDVYPIADESCRDYSNKIGIPPIGTHVRIVSSYVLDQNHGWTEIHPVTSIEITK